MRSVTGVCLVAFACGIALLQTRPLLPEAPGAITAFGICLYALGVALRRRGNGPLPRAGYAARLAVPSSRAAPLGLISSRAAPLALILSRAAPLALILSAVALLGFGYAAWRAEIRLADELPPTWEGEDIRVVGVVDDLPQVSSRGTRFAFAVERVLTPRAMVPGRLSLTWLAPRLLDGGAQALPLTRAGEPRPLDGGAQASPLIRAGERWAFTVRLKRPHGNVNPGGFDLEAWLLERNLRATGYVRGNDVPQKRTAFAGRPRDYVQQSRERIRARILRALPDAPYAGVIVALVIGDQRAIPDAQWTVFNRTGITHLVSISGLHVTVFATIAGALAFALARRSVRLTSFCPARKIAAAWGLFAATGYVLLAGAEVPAVRTLAMLAVGTIGLWCGRPGTAGIVWVMALAAVLVWDPWATLSPGFWLSFGAVGLLLYAASGRIIDAIDHKSWRDRCQALLRRSARAQGVVTLGLIPLTLGLFEQVSLVSPLANALAIPIVTAAVVPLALSGIALPWDYSFQAAHALVAPLLHGLEWIAAAPDAAWQQHAPLRWTVVAGVAGVLWLLAPRGVPGRGWAILWLVPLFVVREAPPAEGTFRLTVLDVGQGLAAVVATRHHALVYDTGPRFHETADAGGRIVAPFLRRSGIRHADGLIVSHGDLDHAGGADSLLQLVPLGWLLSSLPDDHAIIARARAKGVALTCLAGQGWTWDDVRFTVLHPTLADVHDPATKTNDRSCVVRIDTAHGSALLTGDIEARVEARLLREGAPLQADVLVVPHHGSRTSSTPAFVAAVAPRIAVFAAGYRNHFGHPRADVVARYVRANAQIARTDQAGAIGVTVGRDRELVLEGARALAPRYWHDPPSVAAAALD